MTKLSAWLPDKKVWVGSSAAGVVWVLLTALNALDWIETDDAERIAYSTAFVPILQYFVPASIMDIFTRIDTRQIERVRAVSPEIIDAARGVDVAPQSPQVAEDAAAEVGAVPADPMSRGGA